jgi:hypothetical protein
VSNSSVIIIIDLSCLYYLDANAPFIGPRTSLIDLLILRSHRPRTIQNYLVENIDRLRLKIEFSSRLTMEE